MSIGELTPSSTRRDISGGDVSFGANLTLTGYIRKRPLILEGRFRMETRSPDYWQENLFSNHYVWLHSFAQGE